MYVLRVATWWQDDPLVSVSEDVVICKGFVRIPSGTVVFSGLDRQRAVELLVRIGEKKINKSVKLLFSERKQCLGRS